MVVVGSEGGIAFGTLALPGLIAGLEALETEDVEALSQHRVLLLHLA